MGFLSDLPAAATVSLTRFLPFAGVNPQPSQAQSSSGYDVLRAVNTARLSAEFINGGVSKYRRASCMFQSLPNPCLITSNSNGLLFRFLGGPPGWQQLKLAPTVETEIMISPDGRSVLSVPFNGPPR
jgi:hypothetical protein